MLTIVRSISKYHLERFAEGVLHGQHAGHTCSVQPGGAALRLYLKHSETVLEAVCRRVLHFGARRALKRNDF